MEPSPLAQRTGLEPGTVLRNTYTVVKMLGRGRFADAYLVRHRYMGMQVMKLLVDGESDADRAEGLGEAFLLSKITHPGIVRVYDANRLDSTFGHHPYITMEHVSGGTIAELLASAPGGLSLSAGLEIARQVAAALGHAHDLPGGLIHRDVKPSNILVESFEANAPVIRVADFGLATRINRFTKVASSGGTLLYMSPESIHGYETAASDVFSAGLLLYELLTGTLPYPKRALADATGVAELKKTLQVLHAGDLAPPSAFNPVVPPDVDAMTLRALHHDEHFRFPTGTAFARALAACQHALLARESLKIPTTSEAALREIFRRVNFVDGAQAAIRDLDVLTASDQSIGRAYTPHLHQLQIQWNRFKRESADDNLPSS